MSKKDYLFILKSFLVWRLGLFVILFLAVKLIPLQYYFLGGGIESYTKSPWLWAWANFDGENYISIAKYGFLFIGQAFFPLYPLLMRFFGSGVWAGLLIANTSFLFALVGLYKLIILDYPVKIARFSILLLLFFPTSFYFGSVYTESLFLALTVWSFIAVRREKWLMAGVLGAIASATRVIGVFLLPVLLIQALAKGKKLTLKHWPLILIPLGIVLYMAYLWQATGDPLAFVHAQPGVGEHRSVVPILLPQVFYRYLFKIIPNLTFSYFPIVFTTFLELGSALLFLALSFFSFFKLGLPYSLFLALGYLLPTISGSFSSLPRYVLVLFPGFILMAIWMNKLAGYKKIIVFTTLFAGLIVASSMYLIGYWIS